VCIITENQSDVGAFADFKDDAPAAAATAEMSVPVVAPPAPAQAAPVVAPLPTPAAPVPAATPAWSGGERVFTSPLARRLAAEKGLDLAV
jgi:pyruvate dehydrogenase E2 component (dihydrolipoamide acetyltransferase)